MAIEDAFRFCNLVASPDFVTAHSDLLPPLADATAKDDPDAVASLAAAKQNLHFTGAELKQAGAQIAESRAQLSAAMVAPTVGFMRGPPRGVVLNRDEGSPFGPGGVRIGVPGVTPPGMDIALKITMQTIARQMKADGKSDDEIRRVLMGLAGGSTAIDQASDGTSITGSGLIDDILKSTASVAVGTLQGIADVAKKVSDTIFSGW